MDYFRNWSVLCLVLWTLGVGAVTPKDFDHSITGYKNYWSAPPVRIPSDYSVDAPLMGNGDMLACLGFDGQTLRYYLSKNDFWRLKSQADGLSGPRVSGYFNLIVNGFSVGDFSASQTLSDGTTTCVLKNDIHWAEVVSWVAATENVMVVQIRARKGSLGFRLNLSAPENKQAKLAVGDVPGSWLTRSFSDDVDLPAMVALGFKQVGSKRLFLNEGESCCLAVCMESKFKTGDPLTYIQQRLKGINLSEIEKIRQRHLKWWQDYWGRSSVSIPDTLLEKAWFQGLYTMGACSRDKQFPPGLFGWTTNDTPAWNGDYHLNYNFQAPFYSLASANHLEQAEPHDSPLIDFIPRGEWYAREVTGSHGVLYPVGIGPLGIEVTRNFPNEGYRTHGDIENGGLFFGQRSNALYGLVNMAQYWRCTYDKKYGEKIFSYVLGVVGFWEDYLKLENNRYVIYGDAIHEGSGLNKNPILTLGLLKNALDLMIDLSLNLKREQARLPKWRDMQARLSPYPVQERHGRKVFRYTEEGVDWWNDNGLGIQHIYPGNGITLESDTEMLTVARNTIDEMQRWHDSNTSNSFYMAAIRVGYNPVNIIRELHKYVQNTYPNGFQKGNPHGIENSCTVTNAVNEMLCMSVGNVIRLFPAFLDDAQFRDIRTWGAFLVSATSKSGSVKDVRIKSEKGNTCTIKNPWGQQNVFVIRNGKTAEKLSGNKLTFKTSENEVIELKPNTN